MCSHLCHGELNLEVRVCGPAVGQAEDFCERVKAEATVAPDTLHGVRLAAVRLPVCKHAHIVAVKNTADHWSRLLPHGLLAVMWTEHRVKTEVA